MYDQCKRPTYYFGVAYMRFKGNRLTLEQSNEGNAPFTFDRVFGMSSQQIDIFDFSIRSTVEDVMNGYNGTVFAYGWEILYDDGRHG
jgi:kinesin family protein 5